MKNQVKILSTVALVLFLLSFSNEINLTTKNIEKVEVDNQSGWKQATCYKHLYYRIIQDNYPGKWYIEFKNNYNALMTLSVEIQDGYGGGRMDIHSGKTYRSYYFTNNKNASGIYFSVNKVKFNDTSWGGPYYNCDH